MVEFEDRDDKDRELFLAYLREHPPAPCSA
jgi:hypothetical protein